MTDRLLTIERAPGRWQLRGQIDERAKLVELAAEIPPGELVLDLAGVTYINSIGVREWVSLLRVLTRRGITPFLERCAEVIVHQMSMIDDARGGVVVISTLAPFLCDACGWDGHAVLVIAEVEPLLAAGRTPTTPCPDCGATAAFADLVDSYFLFLR